MFDPSPRNMKEQLTELERRVIHLVESTPGLDYLQIAFSLNLRLKECITIVDSLVKRGFIDCDEDKSQ